LSMKAQFSILLGYYHREQIVQGHFVIPDINQYKGLNKIE